MTLKKSKMESSFNEGFAILKLGKTGWIGKERPKCGPLDAIVKPLKAYPALLFTPYGKAHSETGRL